MLWFGFLQLHHACNNAAQPLPWWIIARESIGIRRTSVPQLRRPIERSCGEPAPIRAPGHSADGAAVPRSTSGSRPVPVSKTRARRSCEPVATRFPSGLNATPPAVRPPWNAYWQSRIGQRDHFSYYDTVICRGLYPYPNDRWLDSTWGGSQGGTLLLPWNVSFATAVNLTPLGGFLFIKNSGSYPAIGVHSHAVTIDAPGGPVILGN